MAKGLLYILASAGEPGELHDWFHSQRAHDVLSANSYHAADGQKPEWLAVYELGDVSQAEDWLRRLQSSSSSAPRFGTVDARIYELFSERASPLDVASVPNRVFRTVGLQPGPELSDKDYNEWYEEEHVPLLSAVPGWLKSTRWNLRGVIGFHHGTLQEGKKSQHLSIHEWESEQSFSTPEFKHATNTPWRDRIIPKLNKELGERRNFKPHTRIL
jgi:hypothetical protein